MNESVTGDLGQSMAALARSLSAPRTVEERLRAITGSVVELMPSDTCAGILLVSKGNRFETVAPTSPLLGKLDAVQEQLGQGPCVVAAIKNLVVRSDDLRAETRWPEFAAAAVEVGILSSISFQLYTSREKMGALNLFAFEPNAFAPEDEATVEVLAAHAALALTAARTEEQLRSAISSRDIIGQAKGMLMERFGIDAIEAFDLLAKLSQQMNIRLNAVAQQIVERR
ncbi:MULTISPECIES: GAF and ANTAR domain-containing protein [unclassified Rhodococcus (in: high G+C Gram-positive bacteria)]|uniref:GAF and ANTAR domain-containing protein n=1 Tax=unclassified Rhodococcus (in: high G+C Gram-positive bacteria) TaxID=192944 RepID=UPI00163B434E|nr:MULTISPECIES: GAF and ANTAR domain-containing protein [unclassified Rhodococcus (in: high G+C Gram-positive bacteria)]MBC2642009.1 GAF and ANTAR domain-containing protein [Rhodococcus sp. 3A]MBC2893249.1 GAF and ANTAR domain-containing protein [Rhodococcus sp. 4CII]